VDKFRDALDELIRNCREVVDQKIHQFRENPVDAAEQLTKAVREFRDRRRKVKEQVDCVSALFEAPDELSQAIGRFGQCIEKLAGSTDVSRLQTMLPEDVDLDEQVEHDLKRLAPYRKHLTEFIEQPLQDMKASVEAAMRAYRNNGGRECPVEGPKSGSRARESTGPVEPKSKGGRPRLSDAERQRRWGVEGRWEHARAAGVRQKEFASDERLSMEELERSLNWCSKQRSRGQTGS